MEKIIIYADGGARNNGAPDAIGGYGVMLTYMNHSREIFQGYRGVTNNQMEIRAVVEGLKMIKNENLYIEIRTDSAYVSNCINKKWYKKWMDNGWLNSKKQLVENRELWIELLEELKRFKNYTFVKVKGHSGEPGNERADVLANKAMDSIAAENLELASVAAAEAEEAMANDPFEDKELEEKE